MKQTVVQNIWLRRALKHAAIPIGVVAALYLAWVALRGPQAADICAGVALLLFLAYMIDLKRSEVRADRGIVQRIREEYPAETQPQVLELYDRLKAKELEYLFVKVLDDAAGDLGKATKLTGLAESIGWKAFLESHW